MLLRFYELYKPFPGSGSNISVYVKIIIGLYNIPLMLFGFVGIFDYHQKNKINVMLYFTIPIFVLTFIHCISNAPHSRYSLPLVPILLIFGMIFIQNKTKMISHVQR